MTDKVHVHAQKQRILGVVDGISVNKQDSL